MANGPDNTMQDLIRLQSMLPTANKPGAMLGILQDVQFSSTGLAAAAPKIGDGKMLNAKQKGGKFFDRLLSDMGFNKDAFASVQQTPLQPSSVADIAGPGLAGGSFADMVGGSRSGGIEIG